MGIKHVTVATGTNDPGRQVSKDAWNSDHTGGIEASVMTANGDLIYNTGEDDVSRNVGTTWSESSNNGNGVANVHDGSDSTYWQAANGGGYGWVKADCGSAVTIGSYRIYKGAAGGDWILESSSDNSNWTQRASGGTNDGTVQFGTPITARHWRVSPTSGDPRIYTVELIRATSPARLAIGSDNYVLRVAGTVPAWEAEFDATAPSTQAFGDAAATGSAATAARRDHKHEMPLVSYLDSYSRPLDGTMGDDFTEASLNARWTRVTFTSGMESYQQGGGSWMVVDMSSATQAAHYYQTCPSGDWEFIASFAVIRNHSSQMMYGLCVVDSSGNGRGVAFYTDENAYLATIATNAYSTYTQVWTGLGRNYYLGGKVWGRIRKSGTTIYVSCSNNGTIWSQEYSVVDSSTWSKVFIGRVYGTQTTERFAIDLFDRVS